MNVRLIPFVVIVVLAGVQGCGNGGSEGMAGETNPADSPDPASSATIDGKTLLACLDGYQFTRDDFTYLAFSAPSTAVYLEQGTKMVAYATVGPVIPGYDTRGDPGVDIYLYEDAATAAERAGQVPVVHLTQQAANVIWLYAASGGENFKADTSTRAFDKAIAGCIQRPG